MGMYVRQRRSLGEIGKEGQAGGRVYIKGGSADVAQSGRRGRVAGKWQLQGVKVVAGDPRI